MIRAARFAAAFVGGIFALALGSVLLFWLGRPIEEARRGELVVDDIDDSGIDIDEEDPCVSG